MTNFEKYMNDLSTTNFAIKNGKPVICDTDVECKTCDFEPGSCHKKRMEWLKAEYEKPKIAIPDNTPIDTKVLVSNNGNNWFRRYYAGLKDGEHSAWSCGADSWSCGFLGDKTPWEYMKLAEED